MSIDKITFTYAVLSHNFQFSNNGVHGCSFASTGHTRDIYTKLAFCQGFHALCSQIHPPDVSWSSSRTASKIAIYSSSRQDRASGRSPTCNVCVARIYGSAGKLCRVVLSWAVVVGGLTFSLRFRRLRSAALE